MMRITGHPAWRRLGRGVARGLAAPIVWVWVLVRFVLRSAGRTFALDLQRLRLTGRERQLLEGQEPAVSRYVVWRRAALFVAMALLAANLGWQIHSFLELEADADLHGLWSVWYYVLEIVRLAAVGLLPVAAGVSCLLWRRLRWGKRVLLLGLAFAFVIPILLAAVPLHVVVDWDGLGQDFNTAFEAELAKQGMSKDDVPEFAAGQAKVRSLTLWFVDVLGAVVYTALLVPSVFALFPGVLRACLRVKTLLPRAITPGWFLISVVPLYLVLTIVVFGVLNVIFRSPQLTTSLVMFVVAPLLYLLNLRSMLRPWQSAGRRRVTFVLGWLAMLLNLAALVLLVTYLSHQEFAFQGKVRTILGRSADDAFLDYWDLGFWLADYFGRSLFLMVVVADLLLQATVALWRHAATGDEAERLRAFAGVMGKVATSPQR